MIICWLKMCITICGCYCKYRNDFSYKAPVNGMIIMFLVVVIVNTAMSWVIKFHMLYDFFQQFVGLQVSLNIEEGEGSVRALVKILVKSIRPWLKGHLFQAEWWKKHPSGCSFRLLWLMEIGKGNGKGFGKAKRNFWHIYL